MNVDASKFPELKLCPGCGRFTRPSKKSKDLYPFKTVPRHSGGYCWTCWNKNQKAVTAGKSFKLALADPDKQTMRAYLTWKMARDQRLAKARRAQAL